VVAQRPQRQDGHLFIHLADLPSDRLQHRDLGFSALRARLQMKIGESADASVGAATPPRWTSRTSLCIPKGTVATMLTASTPGSPASQQHIRQVQASDEQDGQGCGH